MFVYSLIVFKDLTEEILLAICQRLSGETSDRFIPKRSRSRWRLRFGSISVSAVSNRTLDLRISLLPGQVSCCHLFSVQKMTMQTQVWLHFDHLCFWVRIVLICRNQKQIQENFWRKENRRMTALPILVYWKTNFLERATRICVLWETACLSPLLRKRKRRIFSRQNFSLWI